MIKTLRKSNPVLDRVGRIIKGNKKTVAVIGAIYLLSEASKYLSWGARNNWIKDEYDWSKEIILVTGGSSGIGQTLVQRLAARNLKVVVLDITPLPFAAPSNVHFFKCDITSKAEVSEVAERIREIVGDPTVLVNNAGVARNASILEKKLEDIEFTFSVNTFSHYNTVQEFLPSMLSSQHGHVITIASMAAHLVSPLVSDYQMSKSAALAFHESLGTELKHVYNCPQIRTSVIMPGYVATPLHKDNAFGKETNPLLKAAISADEVATKIEEVILGGTSATVAVPSALSMLTGIRGMPEWMQRRLMDRTAVSLLT